MTQSDTHFYEPEAGHGLVHDPLKAIIAPRPIAWISTVDRDGRHNLAPYSFFNAVSSDPPIVFFSSERENSDTLKNARETGEFVVNVATGALAAQVSDSSAPFPHGVSEFGEVGLTPSPCRIVRAPRLSESPASLECKVTDIRKPVGLDGAESLSTMVFGQVVGVHIRRDAIRDGRFDTAGAGLLGRCGYLSDYIVASPIVKVTRPKDITRD